MNQSTKSSRTLAPAPTQSQQETSVKASANKSSAVKVLSPPSKVTGEPTVESTANKSPPIEIDKNAGFLFFN